MFIEASGKPNVVCFKNTTEFIVNDKWFSKRKKDSHDKATRIVVIAAELILNNTHSAKFNCGFYPTREDIEGCEKSKEWLSDYLKFFLENILKYPLKQASICQAIANAIRPRSCIAPILFGVGAEAEHVVGQKWLVKKLSRLGFGVSIDEVTQYKQFIMENEDVGELISVYFPLNCRLATLTIMLKPQMGKAHFMLWEQFAQQQACIAQVTTQRCVLSNI